MSKFYFINIFDPIQYLSRKEEWKRKLIHLFYFFIMAFLIKILALVKNFSVWSKLVKVEASKGTLSYHLSTDYFSHLSYIQDQLKKCIHILKPLTLISSCCQAFSVLPDNPIHLIHSVRGFEICIRFLSWSWI